MRYVFGMASRNGNDNVKSALLLASLKRSKLLSRDFLEFFEWAQAEVGANNFSLNLIEIKK